MANLVLSSYLLASRERIVRSLLHWLQIPSISADPQRSEDLWASARFCAELLGAAGLEHVAVLDSPIGPAVYADWLRAGPQAPTVLIYGHHDVQPVDPLEEWTSPPFQPIVVDGECRARGAVDDKGQVLYQIEACRGLLSIFGALPVNVKFLIEGEEEVGSPHLEDLLMREADRLACDVIVVSDTGMISLDVPSTTISMRGLVAFGVFLRTASTDLHSGLWGGAVPNAATVAARVVSGLHDQNGRVAIPGFYDDVRELSAAERALLAAQPFDEAAFKAEAGGVRCLAGEVGYSTVERIGTRPTAEVVGIHSGYEGPGIKTIVPAVAEFRVAFRLVPDQRPDRIAALFRSWLTDQVPEALECQVSCHGAVAPASTPIDHPAIEALARAIEKVWGVRPLFTREGGSGPEEALARVLQAPLVFLGIGLPGDRIHAPNERMVMDQFFKGLLAAGELILELGRGLSSSLEGHS
jgi:acetylornithine deacetylase/succinyl-diaminopimelate desuccinylase-like protein